MASAIRWSRTALFAGCLALVQCALAASYTLVDVGTLGGLSTWPSAINNRGDVVGQAITASGSGHIFLYANGVFTDLGSYRGMQSFPNRINDSGVIVGYDVDLTSGDRPQVAIRWSAGTYTDLGNLGASEPPEAEAIGINDSGQIVGFSSTDSAGPGSRIAQHAFLYENGTMADLAPAVAGSFFTVAMGINNVGQVVGFSNSLSDPCLRSFLYQNGSATYLPRFGACGEIPRSINDAGDIAGGTGMFGVGRAYLYRNGAYTDLGTLPGTTGATAVGINNHGQIVGQSGDGSYDASRAFLYENGVMKDLNDFLPAGSPWTLVAANAINDRGQIVGVARVAGDLSSFKGFLMTPTAPADDIASLQALVQSFNLPQGIETSLLAKLNAARAAVLAGQNALACSDLAAFINEVQAQAGKKITRAQADALLAAATSVRSALGCA